MYQGDSGKRQAVWQQGQDREDISGKSTLLIDLTFPRCWTGLWKSSQTNMPSATPPATTWYILNSATMLMSLARALIALGVKPGDHVAIWATNVPQWFITFWATVKIGAVLVTVNTAYKIYEVEYLLRQSDTHTLVMIDGYKDVDYLSIIRKLCPELETSELESPLPG